jgi:UDP-N-acetylglucosamine diphosphorylase/glucosamine-1-phosphate N-acetyltransferase
LNAECRKAINRNLYDFNCALAPLREKTARKDARAQLIPITSTFINRYSTFEIPMAIILFDNTSRKQLLPLTATRAVADLRFGILTIRERWEKIIGEKVYVHTDNYLQGLYELPEEGEHTWVDASVIDDIRVAVLSLAADSCLADEKGLIAGKAGLRPTDFDPAKGLSCFDAVKEHTAVKRIEYPWQLMQWNDEMIRADFSLVTKGRRSMPVPETVHAIKPSSIFIEEGAHLQHCIINASTGPVYIGKNAEVMEGSAIRGPFVLGDHSVLKLNSRVYGATTLGAYCLGGGEIKNTVMMDYSNKAHDGYLGDSVVGEWCNFGAGSTNSNIKNTAGDIKIRLMDPKESVMAGNKCGVIMGDYSRVAINSSINTGSIIGSSCNVFGTGLLPTFINHFSWGVDGTVYDLQKAMQDISNWKKLKNRELSTEEQSVLAHIFAGL